MRKFIFKFTLFSLPVIFYFILAILVVPALLSSTKPSTLQQIDKSFKNAITRDYDLLILGNSRMYRGINPDEFSIKTFNFSHDNDSYNQLYYKLKYVIKKHKISYLILGIDYFQFSLFSTSRNYAYGDYLGEEYLLDYSKRNLLRLKLDHYISTINPKNFMAAIVNMNSMATLRDNGQYIVPGIAKEDDFISRKINRLEIQETYFDRIIGLCKNNNIKVFLVMLPVRSNELNSYSKNEIAEFESYINKKVDKENVFYLNFSTNNNYRTEDYTDITHLSEKGAIKFSKMLNDSIVNIIDQ